MPVIFRASWFDFEEGASIRIDEHSGRYYVNAKGYNVICGDWQEKYEVNEEQVYLLMEKWLDLED